MTTKPISNAGLGFKRRGLRIFIRSRNLWDFALDKKRKNKTKRFRYVSGGKQTLVCPRTVHSSAVVTHFDKL